MDQVLMSNILPISYLYRSVSSDGRINIPVSPSQAIYASFEHVNGVPSSGGAVYSIDKLKILNTLIERLSASRKTPVSAPDSGAQGNDPARLDALIEQYSRELHSLAVRAPMPYRPAVAVTPGTLVSLAA